MASCITREWKKEREPVLCGNLIEINANNILQKKRGEEMMDELSIYAGRKHLGPLDKFMIKSIKGKIEFAKMVLLQTHIEELQSLEELLKKEDLHDYERKVYTMALEVKEEELNDFLGIPNDGKNKNDKLPEV